MTVKYLAVASADFYVMLYEVLTIFTNSFGHNDFPPKINLVRIGTVQLYNTLYGCALSSEYLYYIEVLLTQQYNCLQR